MDVVLFIIVDVVLWTTGGILLWVLTIGRFKLVRPGRGSGSYYLLSLLGLVFWLFILYVSVRIFAG